MRYRLICQVEGALFLSGDMAVSSEVDGIRYELMADETRRVVRAAVSSRVPVSKLGSHGTSIEKPPAGSQVKLHVRIQTDPEVHGALIDALQRLESLLAFGSTGPRIRRIRWDVADKEWIPESSVEEQYAQIAGIGYARAVHEVPSNLSANSFEIMIQNADRYEPMRTLNAFYRQGMVDLQDGQYIQAVYGFYFVLEDMFAHGRSSAKEVTRAFASEPELTVALENALKTFPSSGGGMLAQLKALMDEDGLNWDVDGLRTFLVEIRNRLHHYSARNRTRRQGTPFTQHDFRSAALLLMNVVTLVLLARVVHINKHSGPPKGPPPLSTAHIKSAP